MHQDNTNQRLRSTYFSYRYLIVPTQLVKTSFPPTELSLYLRKKSIEHVCLGLFLDFIFLNSSEGLSLHCLQSWLVEFYCDKTSHCDSFNFVHTWQNCIGYSSFFAGSCGFYNRLPSFSDKPFWDILILHWIYRPI